MKTLVKRRTMPPSYTIHFRNKSLSLAFDGGIYTRATALAAKAVHSQNTNSRTRSPTTEVPGSEATQGAQYAANQSCAELTWSWWTSQAP